MKICTKCKEEKDVTQFNKAKKLRDGLTYYCKSCISESKKLYYQKNKDNVKSACLKYYNENRDAVNERNREHGKHYRIANKEKIREKNRLYQKTERGKMVLRRASMKEREAFPEKFKARNAINGAIRSGKIKRKPCQKCGTSDNIQAHHTDYSKPLDVMWLCHRHHVDIHNNRF